MRLPPLRADYGSFLLGSADESGQITRIRVQLLITIGVVFANAVGVVLAIALATVGIPDPPIPWHAWGMNFIVLPIYIAFAFLVGAVVGTVRLVGSLRWAIRDQVPTEREAKSVFSAPWRLTLLQAALWAGGTAVVGVGYGIVDPNFVAKATLVTALSGVVVCAISYLIVEFALRPSAADALEAGFHATRRGRLRIRAATAWAVGSGVPIVGMVLVAAFGTFRADSSKVDVVIGVLALGAIALFTGPLLTLLNTDTVVAPVRVLSRAVRRVRDGETAVKVRIFDGSDLGELQAGFNSMTAGLAERERLRDLFGRHVGREVADAALGLGVQLGGSEQRVAVIYIDVVGSTAIARKLPPAEVVAVLNRFFEVIVTEVEACDGLVNKFAGDAVLAVFGAPLPHPDPAGAALKAARQIAARLPEAVPGLAAGIGVSYGEVVAGNVGAIERYEYTVIGDPVNESARLSEVAKRDTGVPLAAGPAIAAAAQQEAALWVHSDAVTLRGRDVPTELYAPRAGAVSAATADPTGIDMSASTHSVPPTVNVRSPTNPKPDLV